MQLGLTKHEMGVYRGWLVYCHSRPVVTCWAPSVGRRDMTINTAPSMICHSSHITQTITQGCKNICDFVLQENLVEFGSAQSRHHMVDTENEFDSNCRCPDTDITGRTSQRSKYNEEKTDDKMRRVFGTCVRLSC